MFRNDSLEIWNLTDGGTACTGALDRFLVVGRILDHRLGGLPLKYQLNGGPLTPVAQNPTEAMRERLAPWSFGIDSIRSEMLGDENELEIVVDDGALPSIASVRFRRDMLPSGPCFDLKDRAATARSIEELAQVVDGPWEVQRREDDSPLVQLRTDGAGYDRVCLFTDPLPDSYRIDATLRVTHFKHPTHNVGLVFKWNDHEVGDGTVMPTTWNTGLAYFYSSSPGLRLRVGVGVHVDETGTKVGDHVLARHVMSHTRRWMGRIVSRLPPRGLIVSQLRRDVAYRFVADITPTRYVLRVGEVDGPDQHVLVADDPPDLLPVGAAGVIALNTAVTIEDFVVEPLVDDSDGVVRAEAGAAE